MERTLKLNPEGTDPIREDFNNLSTLYVCMYINYTYTHKSITYTK